MIKNPIPKKKKDKHHEHTNTVDGTQMISKHIRKVQGHLSSAKCKLKMQCHIHVCIPWNKAKNKDSTNCVGKEQREISHSAGKSTPCICSLLTNTEIEVPNEQRSTISERNFHG